MYCSSKKFERMVLDATDISGMSLRARHWLIYLAKKNLITSSNCSREQRHGVILKVQLSKKPGLLTKKPAQVQSSQVKPIFI